MIVTEAVDELNLTELLFEQVPVGIAVFDRDLILQRANPTWVDFIARYTLTPSEKVTPGRSLYELAPGNEATLAPILDRVLAGEMVRLDNFRAESGGIVSYWDVVFYPRLENGMVTGVVDVVIDATERIEAAEVLKETINQLQGREEKLEQRVQERTRELASLLELSHRVASTLDLELLLDSILQQLKSVVDYTGATFLQIEGETLRVLAHRGPIPAEMVRRIRFSLDEAVSRTVLEDRQPLIIADVRADTALARAYRQPADPALAPYLAYVRGWMAVPLAVKDKVIGILSLDHGEPDYYSPQQARLALAFANQVAVYIENAQLYAEARQRADETQTLFTVQQAITRRLDPDAVLQMIADEARRLTDTEMSAVYLHKGSELEISVVSGAVSEQMLGYRLPLDGSVAGLALADKRAYLVEDAGGRGHPLVEEDLVERVGANAFVIVPLMAGDEPIGTITVANKQNGTLGAEDERVLTMLAAGAVIALQNARLFTNLDQRKQELEALYRADEELYRHLDLDSVLNSLVNVAVEILQADKSSVMVWSKGRKRLQVRAQHGFQPETVAQMSFAPGEGIIGQAAEQGRLIIVEDSDQVANVARRITAAEGIRAFMHVPIEINERVFGVFNVSYEAPRAFGEEEQRLFTALAQRAALVIENARLYERAQEAAAAEERNRLARELHDAVTQTLFSASLIADVLPRLWEKDETAARQRLQELRELTRGALAEMRMLLLELRPATLTEVGLNDLLRQLTSGIIGRARLPIQLKLDGQVDLPPDVQVALYRIAQEGLNNVIKHSEADRVTVSLRSDHGRVELKIEDDGRGFDVSRIPHHSLGLSIMQERAENIGAALTITSAPGTGTEVVVRWYQNDDDENANHGHR